MIRTRSDISGLYNRKSGEGESSRSWGERVRRGPEGGAGDDRHNVVNSSAQLRDMRETNKQ